MNTIKTQNEPIQSEQVGPSEEGPLRLILCIKWGKLYGPEHVNRLRQGVLKNLRYPFRFICFTDDPEGLDPEVEAFPLPELNLPPNHGDRRWTKLALLGKDVFGLKGTALFLDLDLVIVDRLEAFFDMQGDLIMIRDMDLFRSKPLRRINPQRHDFLNRVGNSSVFRMEMGKHSYVLDSFVKDPVSAQARFKISQQFMSHELLARSALSYWPSQWCVSFKNHCVPRYLKSYFKNPHLPKGAKIVVFAGNPKMDDVLAGRGSTWYRRIGRSDWLVNAWIGS